MIGFFLLLIYGRLQAQNNQTVENGETTKLITLPGGGCSYKWVVIDNQQIGLPPGGTGDIQPFTAVNKGTKPITAHISVMPLSEGFAYLANSTSNNVSVINTAIHAIVATVPVDSQPFGIAVSPDGRKIYVVNSKNETGHAQPGIVSVIDAATNTVVGNYTVGKNAKAIIVKPDGTRAYVANESGGTVSVLDLTGSNTTIPDISITGALGIAISLDGSRLYVCSTTGQLYVIDAATNEVLKKIPIPSTYPTAAVVSADGSQVYVTNNTGNYICVVDVATGNVQTVTVGTAPFALAITPGGDKIYVSNALSQDVTIINTSTNAVIKTLSMPALCEGISISPNGKQVLVAGQNPNELEVIDAATDQLGTPVQTNQGAAISIGSFVTAGIGCSTVPIVYSITVNPPPNINDPGNVSASSTHYGSASAAQIINVGGNNLKEPITVKAPAGYELSKDDVTFGDMVTVGTSADVSAVEVYVRLKATAPAGIYHGNIELSSTGATTINVPVDGTVLKALLSITASNATMFYGDPLPELTVTYTGFVNGDGPSSLTTQPVTATPATPTSPTGKYPITASGASAINYVFTYIAGTLEIVSGDISTPNTFTPNGDGINDTWDIKNLNLYAGCTVEVLNRYGQKVFYTKGYPTPWDGTLNGKQLPVGTYYYIIKIKSNAKVMAGLINIIR